MTHCLRPLTNKKMLHNQKLTKKIIMPKFVLMDLCFVSGVKKAHDNEKYDLHYRPHLVGHSPILMANRQWEQEPDDSLGWKTICIVVQQHWLTNTVTKKQTYTNIWSALSFSSGFGELQHPNRNFKSSCQWLYPSSSIWENKNK